MAYNWELAFGDSITVEDDSLGEFFVYSEEIVQQALDHFVQVVDHLVRVASWTALSVKSGSVKAALLVQAANDL